MVRDHEGSLCIHKHKQKTGILSIIPLLKPAERILIKYSPTEDPCDVNWNVITNQKLNEHLKTLQKLANIEQEMYFHLARHTFATTITLSNGLPVLSNQKYNAYLKILQEVVGINYTSYTPRTPHFCNYNYSSARYSYRKVSKMLGHSKVTMTQVYAKITQQKIAYDMKDLQKKIDQM